MSVADRQGKGRREQMKEDSSHMYGCYVLIAIIRGMGNGHAMLDADSGPLDARSAILTPLLPSLTRVSSSPDLVSNDENKWEGVAVRELSLPGIRRTHNV